MSSIIIVIIARLIKFYTTFLVKNKQGTLINTNIFQQTFISVIQLLQNKDIF